MRPQNPRRPRISFFPRRVTHRVYSNPGIRRKCPAKRLAEIPRGSVSRALLKMDINAPTVDACVPTLNPDLWMCNALGSYPRRFFHPPPDPPHFFCESGVEAQRKWRKIQTKNTAKHYWIVCNIVRFAVESSGQNTTQEHYFRTLL